MCTWATHHSSITPIIVQAFFALSLQSLVLQKPFFRFSGYHQRQRLTHLFITGTFNFGNVTARTGTRSIIPCIVRRVPSSVRCTIFSVRAISHQASFCIRRVKVACVPSYQPRVVVSCHWDLSSSQFIYCLWGF